MAVIAPIQGIDSILLPLGFSRKKMTWRRRTGDFEDIISVQLSKDRERFTLSMGVVDHVALALYGESPSSDGLQDHDCTVRARLGELLDGLDLWWAAEEEVNLGQLGQQLTDIAVPFLETLHDPILIIRRLELEASRLRGYPPPLIYIAIEKWRLGLRAEARNHLDELIENVPQAWKPRVVKVAEKLGTT
jgi:hypothetical protein